jgi:stage V sporulation protein B
MAIAPTMFCICIIGAIRGYFQGHEMMEPTATSQLIESLGKLFLGVGFAVFAISSGASDEEIAAAAVLGLSVGMFFSLLYLLIRLYFFKRRSTVFCADESTKSRSFLLCRLVVIAAPITLAASVTGITSLTDTALITNRLVDMGYADSVARMMYSSYTNLAVPLFNMPTALLSPLAVSIVPTITAAVAQKDGEREKNVFDSSFRLCVFLSLPAAAGMSVFAKQILSLVFVGQDQAVSAAAPLLSVLSVSIIFSCLTALTNAVLQTYNRRAFPIVSMFTGALVKIAAEYILIGSIGIVGAPVSTFLCTLTVAAMNVFFIEKKTPHKLDIGFLWRALAATAVAILWSVAVFAAVRRVGETIALFAAIIAAVAVYIPLGIKLRAVRYEDILQLPHGGKIAKFLEKIKLIEVKNENTKRKDRVSRR